MYSVYIDKANIPKGQHLLNLNGGYMGCSQYYLFNFPVCSTFFIIKC